MYDCNCEHVSMQPKALLYLNTGSRAARMAVDTLVNTKGFSALLGLSPQGT